MRSIKSTNCHWKRINHCREIDIGGYMTLATEAASSMTKKRYIMPGSWTGAQWCELPWVQVWRSTKKVAISTAADLNEQSVSCEMACTAMDASTVNTHIKNKINISTGTSASRLRVLMVRYDEKLTLMTIHASKWRKLTDAEEERLLSPMILHQ